MVQGKDYDTEKMVQLSIPDGTKNCGIKKKGNYTVPIAPSRTPMVRKYGTRKDYDTEKMAPAVEYPDGTKYCVKRREITPCRWPSYRMGR
jgi:hypothetical protein